jgi:cellulose synthase (UDP-forming)
MHATLPLLFLFFGIVPIEVSGMILASVFLPYMFLTLYTLQLSSNFSYTFHSFAFSMAAFNVHISAFLAAVTGRRSAFSITPKTRSSGTYVRFVTPQLAYLAIAASGMVYALMREGLSASVVNNGAWVLFNAVVFLTFVRAAFPETGKARVADPVPADMHAPHAMKV